jgi:hypothetical protein
MLLGFLVKLATELSWCSVSYQNNMIFVFTKNKPLIINFDYFN